MKDIRFFFLPQRRHHYLVPNYLFSLIIINKNCASFKLSNGKRWTWKLCIYVDDVFFGCRCVVVFRDQEMFEEEFAIFQNFLEVEGLSQMMMKSPDQIFIKLPNSYKFWAAALEQEFAFLKILIKIRIYLKNTSEIKKNSKTVKGFACPHLQKRKNSEILNFSKIFYCLIAI